MKGLRDILAENNIRSNLFNRRSSQANAQCINNQKANESMILRQRNSVSGAIAALSNMKGMSKEKVNENWRPYSYLKEKNSRNCSPNQNQSNQKGIFNVFDRKLPVSYESKLSARRASMDLNEHKNSNIKNQEKIDYSIGYGSHRGDNPFSVFKRKSIDKLPERSEKRDPSPQLPGAIRNQQERGSSINKFISNYSSERPRNPSASRTRKVEKPNKGHRHSNSAALDNIEKVIEDAENGIKNLKKGPERKAFIDFSTYLKEKRSAVDNSIVNPASFSSSKQENYMSNPYSYRSNNKALENAIEKERQRSSSISYSKGIPAKEEVKKDLDLSMISGLKHEEGQEVNIDKLKSHFMQYLSLKCQKPSKKVEGDGIDIDKINRANFDFHYVIGKGGFGKVWKVQHKKNRKIYAMKEMSKAKFE